MGRPLCMALVALFLSAGGAKAAGDDWRGSSSLRYQDRFRMQYHEQYHDPKSVEPPALEEEKQMGRPPSWSSGSDWRRSDGSPEGMGREKRAEEVLGTGSPRRRMEDGLSRWADERQEKGSPLRRWPEEESLETEYRWPQDGLRRWPEDPEPLSVDPSRWSGAGREKKSGGEGASSIPGSGITGR